MPGGETMNSKERIVVAMSGGVDSSASAILLSEEGYDVVGVAMQVWDYRNHGGNSSKATCCAPADFDDAREIAEKSNFPFYVFDFEESFEDSVINPFIESYLDGLTPNPCLDCNRKVKFGRLRERALSFGASKVATGHFAQIKDKLNGEYGLFTAKDRTKDQSYFLYAIKQEELSKTIFPVGKMQKSEVREYLKTKGFKLASKPESQDICFVSGTVSEFIEKKRGKLPQGDIVNSKGDVIGRHTGIYGYTVGQRKGIGIGSANPLYVLEVDRTDNKIVVGEKDELAKKEFFLNNVNWISGKEPNELVARVKLRYRHEGELCKINNLGNGRVRLEFLENWTAVSPGQAAVFYSVEPDMEGDYEVFGGGIIEKETR